MSETKLGGRFTFPGTSLTVHRMGYGAMQLAGPGVFGPPRDPDEAVAVLREAIESGVDHIDTSDFYGPHVTNQIIRQALHPYPEGLVIVTKLGAVRGEDASWRPALGRGRPDRGRPRQPQEPRPRRARRRESPRRRDARADGGAHRRQGRGAGRPPAPGADPPRRPEQRHGRPGGRGAGDHRGRVRPEPTTTWPTARTTRSSTTWPGRASPTCRSSRSAGSRRSNRPRCRTSRAASGPRRCRSRWHGCCTARPISC